MKALHETQREEAKALLEQEFASREARMEAMKSLRENHRAAMDNILTEAQKEKLATLKEDAKAERTAERKERMDNFKAMAEEMKTFNQTEVLPVLREQRAKLETQISAEDKATIAALRAKRPAQRSERPDFERGERSQRPELTEAQKEAIRADREQIKALVEKYDSEITSLLEEIKDERESWKTQMQEIGKKYAPEDLRERPMRGQREGQMKRKMDGEKRAQKMTKEEGKRFSHRPGLTDRKAMGKVGFLLLDPNEKTALQNDNKKEFAEVRVFPNPSASRNTVSYTLHNAGHYRVEFRDKDGLVLKVLSNEYRQAGDYREELDLSGYAAGTYYLSLIGAEGVVSKKVVVAK